MQQNAAAVYREHPLPHLCRTLMLKVLVCKVKAAAALEEAKKLEKMAEQKAKELEEEAKKAFEAADQK